MKIMLLKDDGTLHELLDGPEGYNLSNPIAMTFFAGTIVDALKQHYDPFVSRETSETIGRPYVRECICGHDEDIHRDGSCAGTGDMLDPIYHIPADEPCSCTKFDDGLTS